MNNAMDKKNLIIEAATNLFERYGFSKTSLEDIAREAALGKGTIYYYFDSKEDIFFDVARYHAEKFYRMLQTEIDNQKDFADKLSIAIRMPLKLVYEHVPLLMDAIKNLSLNYMHKIELFRNTNKQKMISVLTKIIADGISQGEINPAISQEHLVNIIYDWFLLGDANIIIKNPEEFMRKAELEYDWIIQLVLYGIIKRG